MRLLTSLTLVAAVALTACSHRPDHGHPAPNSPATVMNGHLVGPNQMTLYVFDRDTAHSGKSACIAQCATNWPPLMAPASAQAKGDWRVIARDDGKHQWSYRGKPLYFWAKDGKPGDASGDGVGNVWRIARP